MGLCPLPISFFFFLLSVSCFLFLVSVSCFLFLLLLSSCFFLFLLGFFFFLLSFFFFLHELLDVYSPAFLVESSGGETVSKCDVASTDGFFFGIKCAVFSRCITTNKSIVELAGNVSDHFSFDFKNDFIDDFDLVGVRAHFVVSTEKILVDDHFHYSSTLSVRQSKSDSKMG